MEPFTAASIPAEFERALRAHRAGRVGEAISAYRQIVQQPKAPWEAWHNLAALLAEQGHYAESCRGFPAGAGKEPQRPEPLIDLGKLHLQQGETASACACFEQLVALLPDAAHYNLLGTARAASATGRWRPSSRPFAAIRVIRRRTVILYRR